MNSRKQKSARWKSRYKHATLAGHLDAIGALEKAGVHVVRQGKHVVMRSGERLITIPRHNPIKAMTMGGMVRDTGLTIDEFRKLL